ncbi:S8 family anti-phage peptidase IteS [Providencia sp. wls1916]|uniref:S8 family anti-phage peptidase IteS n=1 Tax=Providencia sp. wls1916 TaxID=2675155 RepID=UPI0012B5C378|nr:S8 family anti-phage peptidase IteS [Providencia sp. wls1916]MTC77725.1 S8 family serine peptidase [Providencia sp. wls1916]
MNRENQRANLNNPFINIPFSRGDLGAIEGGGGGRKLFTPITYQYRNSLISELNLSKEVLLPQLDEFPNALGTLIFKLRETAIAKSHRPTKVASEAGLQPAGHANIDEMLVAAHIGSFDALESVILDRDIQEINANLSAIESILPWSNERKVPTGKDSIISSESFIIRIFQYLGAEATQLNYRNVISMLRDGGVSYSEIPQYQGVSIIKVNNIEGIDSEVLESLISYPGIKYITPEPKYHCYPVSGDRERVDTEIRFEEPEIDLPIVAVFDTGVSGNASLLSPWIIDRDPYVLPPDTRFEHGTMVASLVAGARLINDEHVSIPSTRSLVYDVCGLEEDGSYVSDLILRISEAVGKKSDVKIWNISLGGESCRTQEFSEFAIALDKLSDQYGVLFVIAAGNYVELPRRFWPVSDPSNYNDIISSPAESIRALTVGSVNHVNAPATQVIAGEPAAYSRRGPGPVYTPKPDVVHAGGGVHYPWNAGIGSLKVISPNNTIVHSFGTSFAAPIVSSLAAHTWKAIDESDELNASPSLVKALIIHSAQLTSPDYSVIDRRYYGSGMPEGVLETLFDTDSSFTLVFQANLVPGMRWRKENYPIPDCLLVNGKFKGEIIITAVYSPPVDPNAGSEYVRANVELSFGVINNNSMTGKVPMENEKSQSGYEKAQIESGGKWSPVKIHRAVFKKGVEGDNWGVQAKATLRAFEAPLIEPLNVTIIVTLRSLDNDRRVYTDGVRALSSKNWLNHTIVNRVPINTN